jgi:hypothetical protein
LRPNQLIRTGALLLALAVPARAAAPAWIAGSWFGQGQPNDKSEMWLAHMGADGNFRAQFRACRQGKADDSNQTGTWSLKGDIETIHIAGIDGRPFSRTDSYRILAHGADRQTYRYVPTGFVYNSRRVGETFAMPDCDLTS